MRTTTKLWENMYPNLGVLNLRRPRKNSVIKRTMRTFEYEKRAKSIVERLDPQDSILEIGCGFGGLALEILKLVSLKYTLVDNEKMLTQAKRYLGSKQEYIDAEKIETLQDREFGLFISHACLSETPFEYRKYILENIIKNCQKISVLDYDDMARPTAKMLEDGYEMIPAITEYYLNKYFVIKKTRYNRMQFDFIGETRNA